ncbi:DNA fragmentation factor subunit alpha isoform X1 [Polypterus senegalus]|uniref:DNA fragmentation factor subunit alpha isoform X1 n=1 Tax=Polypterus senegalus TaxID=55291 RepID=UPI0019668D01|nr:DNA fragmentation factor subunit alpha isoform X1 [Polypterus senegalus]
MSTEKACKVCNFSRRKSYGVVASSLDGLKIRGCEALDIKSEEIVTIVLEDDGTIVEDETYFMCLPSNTKFMILQNNESWIPKMKVDGGTAWLTGNEASDEFDGVVTTAQKWKHLARQLKQNLSSIILMSEEQLQTLVDVNCNELAEEMGQMEEGARFLQETLQRVLDRREEERQSRDILQLYLKAAEQENTSAASTTDASTDTIDAPTNMDVNSTSDIPSQSSKIGQRTLMVLKGKTNPQTRLSNQDLQLVLEEGEQNLASLLCWDRQRSNSLVAACEEELRRRTQQVQSLQSLSDCSRPQAAWELPDECQAKRKK